MAGKLLRDSFHPRWSLATASGIIAIIPRARWAITPLIICVLRSGIRLTHCRTPYSGAGKSALVFL